VEVDPAKARQADGTDQAGARAAGLDQRATRQTTARNGKCPTARWIVKSRESTKVGLAGGEADQLGGLVSFSASFLRRRFLRLPRKILHNPIKFGSGVEGSSFVLPRPLERRVAQLASGREAAIGDLGAELRAVCLSVTQARLKGHYRVRNGGGGTANIEGCSP
jgi:hypothetical protein